MDDPRKDFAVEGGAKILLLIEIITSRVKKKKLKQLPEFGTNNLVSFLFF